MRFPVVEGYAFALRRNLIRCDVAGWRMLSWSESWSDATFLMPTVGYKEGHPSHGTATFGFVGAESRGLLPADASSDDHVQVARLVLDALTANGGTARTRNGGPAVAVSPPVVPQVYRFVKDYVTRKVDFQGSIMRAGAGEVRARMSSGCGMLSCGRRGR